VTTASLSFVNERQHGESVDEQNTKSCSRSAAHLTLSEIRTLDSVVHPRPRCNLHGRTRSHALWACAGLLHGRCLPRRCSDWSPMIDVCMGVFSVAGDDHNITSSTTTANTTAINRGTAEHRKQIADASSEAERQRKAHAAEGHSHGTPIPPFWAAPIVLLILTRPIFIFQFAGD
jgi:hypothetical protein